LRPDERTNIKKKGGQTTKVAGMRKPGGKSVPLALNKRGLTDNTLTTKKPRGAKQIFFKGTGGESSQKGKTEKKDTAFILKGSTGLMNGLWQHGFKDGGTAYPRRKNL